MKKIDLQGTFTIRYLEDFDSSDLRSELLAALEDAAGKIENNFRDNKGNKIISVDVSITD